MKFADYERRIVAYIIDVAFGILVSLISLTIIGLSIPGFKLSWAIDVFVPVACLVVFLELLISYKFFNGISIGGAICNVKIVNKDGERISSKASFVRACLLCLPILAVYNIFYMLLLKTQVSFYDESTDTRAINRVEIDEGYDPRVDNND